MSYALYVFHPFIFFFTAMAFARLLGHTQYAGVWPIFPLRLVVSFGLTYAVAILSWNLYEKQFLKLKSRFEYQPRPIPNPARQEGA